MITDEDLFEFGKVFGEGLEELQANFDQLPSDSYSEERLRSRRYSCFLYDPEKGLTKHSHKNFMQTSDINDYLGDVQRSYEELEDDILENKALLSMFKEFKKRTGLSDDSIIEAHQIRWHCKRNVKIPAPEGNHQDGFDFIGIYIVNHENIDGGDLMLFQGKDSAPIFKKRLEPGEFLVLNDRKLYHNAAPLVPTANEKDGCWDLIVLTANKDNTDANSQAA